MCSKIDIVKLVRKMFDPYEKEKRNLYFFQFIT